MTSTEEQICNGNRGREQKHASERQIFAIGKNLWEKIGCLWAGQRASLKLTRCYRRRQHEYK